MSLAFCSIVVGLINLVLDPLLMFTFNLKIAGAAMATAAAQWIGAFFYAVKMYLKRREFGLDSWDIIPTLKDVTVGKDIPGCRD